MIIEESLPKDFEADGVASAPVVSWVLSARTATALQERATQLRRLLAATPDADPREVASWLAPSCVFEHRAVVTGMGRDELLVGVEAVACGEPITGVAQGAADLDSSDVVFVFPGQGTQWAGMGRELLDTSPVFAERVGECEQALAPFVDWSLVDVMRDEPSAPPLDRADVVQPVLWATMVSLAALWESANVSPTVVVGHSQGEVAAAVIAGVLSIEEGARIVALRSQLLAGLAGRSGMISVVLSAEEVEPLVERWSGRLAVAAINGPAAVVVSGDREALTEFEATLSSMGVLRRWVAGVDFAAHSHQVEAVRDEVLSGLASVAPRVGRVPVHSTTEPGVFSGPEMGADYWYANLRGTVRFKDAVEGLVAAGNRMFVEISPHPVLVTAIRDTTDAYEVDAAVVGTLRRGEGSRQRLHLSLGEAFVRGAAVDWTTLVADDGREVREVPSGW